MPPKKKKEKIVLDVTVVPSYDFITPLQAFAFEAHELKSAFQQAGFTEDEAWDLLTRMIPCWNFPGFENMVTNYNIYKENEDD